MPQSDSKVVQVLRSYRTRMDGLDAQLMEDMGRRWLLIEQRLQAEINALADEMARRVALGETITQQMVWKSERYQILKAQMEAEIVKFNRDAVTIISQAQEGAMQLGINAAQDALFMSYPSPLSAAFTRINIGAVESFIGFAGDGSPLYTLLAADYAVAVNAIVDSMVANLAMGQSSAQIARGIMEASGMGLDRAMLIARTESQRAYRLASTEQYRQSGVTMGFMRLVKKDGACIACLMLDGERFESESDLDDHPNGRCTAVPIVEGVDAPAWEFGQDWFANQTEDKQREILGNTRFEMYQNGTPLDAFAGKTHNDTWGDSPQAIPISTLKG